jgi:hypothetical protein
VGSAHCSGGHGGCPSGVFRCSGRWVPPHWVPAVIAGVPLPDVGSGRVGSAPLGASGHRGCSFLTPYTGMATKGIENSNSMVTERYITRITVPRHEVPGQVTGQAAAVQNQESVGDDKSRKALQASRVVSVRSGVLTAGTLAL